jgi:hypothetical protein
MEASGSTSTETSRWRADCLPRRACSNRHPLARPGTVPHWLAFGITMPSHAPATQTRRRRLHEVDCVVAWTLPSEHDDRNWAASATTCTALIPYTTRHWSKRLEVDEARLRTAGGGRGLDERAIVRWPRADCHSALNRRSLGRLRFWLAKGLQMEKAVRLTERPCGCEGTRRTLLSPCYSGRREAASRGSFASSAALPCVRI